MSVERNRIVVLGGGGHARVVIDLLLDGNWVVEGYTDPVAAAENASWPVRYLGNDGELPRLRSAGVSHAIVAVGENAQRQQLADKAASIGFILANAIHRSSQISPSVRLGNGIAIMAQTALNAGTTIGDNTIVNTGATVDHDCRVGRDVHIAPGVRIAGRVTLADRVLVGVGAVVGRGRSLQIGEGAVIGTGAVVIADVPPGVTVVGNPARPLTGIRSKS